MNFRRTAIRVGILLAGCWIASCTPTGSESSELVGKPAADFSLNTVDDHRLTLTQLKGNVVVLDFWATWCPPCQRSLPNLNRMSEDAALARRGLKVVAIDAGEPPAEVKAFLQANGYSLPVVLDPDGAAQHLYQVSAYPTTIVVGRNGTIEYATVGFDPDTSESELSAAVDKALSAPAK